MIRKIVLASVALITIIGLYLLGSKYMVSEMKDLVDKEVSILQTKGFIIEDRDIQESREHLVIDFNNTEEITAYLNQKGQDITKEELINLKGLKIGLDIEYSPTIDSAIVIDIYPLKAPDILYKENRESIKELEEMLKNREILVHIDINKPFSRFNGYVKDINRTLTLKGAKFSGEIENKKFNNFNQTIDELAFHISDILNIKMLNLDMSISYLKGEYSNKANRYFIEKIVIDNENSIVLNQILGIYNEKIENGLLDGKLEFNITSIDYQAGKEKNIFKNISSDIEMNSIDVKSFEALEIISSNSLNVEEEIINQLTPIIKNIIASNPSLEIKELSIDKINQNGKEFDGFNTKILVAIDKDFNIKSIESDLSEIDNMFLIKSELEMSNELALNIFSDPRAMLLMLVFKPIDKNGKKYFNIEFNKGSLKINGMPFI